MEIILTGASSGYKRYLDISKEYRITKKDNESLVYGYFKRYITTYNVLIQDDYGDIYVRETPEEIKKLIEVAKFNNEFEELLK